MYLNGLCVGIFFPAVLFEHLSGVSNSPSPKQTSNISSVSSILIYSKTMNGCHKLVLDCCDFLLVCDEKKTASEYDDPNVIFLMEGLQQLFVHNVVQKFEEVPSIFDELNKR